MNANIQIFVGEVGSFMFCGLPAHVEGSDSAENLAFLVVVVVVVVRLRMSGVSVW